MFKTKILTLIAVFSLSAAIAQQPVTKISGEITGDGQKQVPGVTIYFDAHSERVELDKETFTFSAELELEKPQFIDFKFGDNGSHFVYVTPGEEIKISVEKPILSQSVVSFDSGKLEPVNNVMDQFYNTITESGLSIQMAGWFKDLLGREQLVSEALLNARKKLNENESQINQLAPDFKQDFERFATALVNYLKVDELSLNEIETILEDISNSEMKITVLTIPNYKEFLVDISNAYAARKLEMFDLVLEYQRQGYIAQTVAAEACVKYIPNQGVINYLFYEKINRELLVGGVKHRSYLDFMFEHSSQKVMAPLKEKYDGLVKNSVQKSSNERVDAIDFEFKNTEGNAFHLDDFKGKLLFIDFWASWCAPCKAQMPHLKELEEFYKGKDIVFAKVSLDADKDAWLKSVEKEGMEGVVLHAEGNFKNPFPVAYGINAIPRFMLIDENGKMINDNMPKPQFKKEVMGIIDANLFNNEVTQIMENHFQAVGAKTISGEKIVRFTNIQSVMGMENNITTWYKYTDILRIDHQPVENAAFRSMLGDDFFKPRYIVIQKDSIFGTVKNLAANVQNWHSKLNGLELLIVSKVYNAHIEFAEENNTNTDNQYVLQANYNNITEKYFIDKDDYLVKKIILTSPVNPRMGGGVMDIETKFEDFIKTDGLMVPHSATINNMIMVKTKDVEFLLLDNQVFSDTFQPDSFTENK